MKWFRTAIQCRDHFTGVFDNREKLLGYAISVVEDDKLYIANLAVDQDHRRSGVGRALVEDAIRFGTTKNRTIAFLEVRISNDGAIKLYESLGFAHQKIEEGYYGDGEDAVVLVRKIDGVV